MYEMYPQQWGAEAEQPEEPQRAEKPRRRARREHTVAPRVIRVANR